MNFKERLNQVLSKLGLEAKVKDGSTTSAENTQIINEYRALFNTELKDDLAAEQEARSKAAIFDEIKGILKPEASANPVNEIKSIVEENQKLNAVNKQLGEMAQKDAPEAVAVANIGFASATTDKYLYGIEHNMFAMDRRYNLLAAKGRVIVSESDPSDDDYAGFKAEIKLYGKNLAARMSDLHKDGLLNPVALTTTGSVDYSNLSSAGLGDQYVVRRMDALIAQILMLPGLNEFFSTQSYIQDKELLTNAFLGEFSQGYQSGEYSKGGVTFDPEVGKVHDVMFKYLIKSWKWIETQYLGYLNTSGSDPVKWNMIEWFILQVAKVLKNEQNARLMRGCYAPIRENKNGHFLHAATGVIYRLLSYVQDHKVLPFEDTTMNGYTSSDIGDQFKAACEEVSKLVEVTTGLVLYANATHKPWYLAWYRSKYGKDIDYSGNKLSVMDYDMPIVFLPNMGSMKFFFITYPENISLLENVPGEMTKFAFEQRLESVWSWSVWKEGVSARFAGKKFATLAALKANGRKDQAIFMNYPHKQLAADATICNATDGFIFRTGINTVDKTITDITNAIPGVAYIIEYGDSSKKAKVVKSDKFSTITADFDPATVGDWLMVYYDATESKFYEIARKLQS